jgi:hypothetical protein
MKNVALFGLVGFAGAQFAFGNQPSIIIKQIKNKTNFPITIIPNPYKLPYGEQKSSPFLKPVLEIGPQEAFEKPITLHLEDGIIVTFQKDGPFMINLPSLSTFQAKGEMDMDYLYFKKVKTIPAIPTVYDFILNTRNGDTHIQMCSIVSPSSPEYRKRPQEHICLIVQESGIEIAVENHIYKPE